MCVLVNSDLSGFLHRENCCLEWPEKPYRRNNSPQSWTVGGCEGLQLQAKTDRKVAAGNTTLTVLTFFRSKTMSDSTIKSKMFKKTKHFNFFGKLWNTFFFVPPLHLWVVKYSCISVWNDWETISRWDYNSASPRWKSSQAAGHSRKGWVLL